MVTSDSLKVELTLGSSVPDQDTLTCSGADDSVAAVDGVATFNGCYIIGTSGDTDYITATDSAHSRTMHSGDITVN